MAGNIGDNHRQKVRDTMKCTHSIGRPPVYACPNDATWLGYCPEHGGKHPSVEELMTLLAKLTGWSDQSLSVEIGFKRARTIVAQDESYLNENVRGFIVSTKLIGHDHSIGAQGADLLSALWALCEEIVKKTEDAYKRQARDAYKARETLSEFVVTRIGEQAR